MTQLLGNELDRKYHLVAEQGVRWAAGRRLTGYRFRHILFQQYLYAQQEKTVRARLHEAVATCVEEQYVEERYVEAHGEIALHLAHHFQAAGVPSKAITYLERAGKRSIQLGALAEATIHITTALELLDSLADSVFPSRQAAIRQEISLRLKQG